MDFIKKVIKGIVGFFVSSAASAETAEQKK